jgi:hypothetical protein
VDAELGRGVAVVLVGGEGASCNEHLRVVVGVACERVVRFLSGGVEGEFRGVGEELDICE